LLKEEVAMMDLQVKMWLLMALMFGILYGVITAIGSYLGIGNAIAYIALAVLFIGFQYLLGPSMVSLMMRIRYVSEKEEPELHRQIAELSRKAGIPKPKVGISQLSIPNAFAFGRTIKDGRVCITEGIQRLLSKDELKAVLGHEIAHIKHRDMMIITLLSIIPLILYWVAFNMMWGGMLGGRRRQEGGGYAVLIGMGAFLLYFLTNLLILYGSRIREYYADERSVRLGNPPHHLASALYKLVYGAARARETVQGTEDLRRVGAVRAFFLNDVERAWSEVKELREVDRDLSGTIDREELSSLRSKRPKLSSAEKIMEIFTTHPNMLKRIKHLSLLG
jgi:heat shock protein HtpX